MLILSAHPERETRLMELPNLAKTLTLRLEPMSTNFNTERFPPARPNDRSDKDDPKLVKSLTDNALPTSVAAFILNVESPRNPAVKLMLLPSRKNARTEILLPKHAKLQAEMATPRFTFLVDNELPMCR
jgi:hypothetical protein